MSKIYKATIEVVTPVHIGVFDFDYFSFFQKEGYLYVIDWVKVFRHKTLFDNLKLILDKQFDNEEEWFNYYKNEFIERYKEEIIKNNLITERIKINKGLNKEITSFHRNLKFHIRYFDFEKGRDIPYLPGSSIKGALGEIFQLSKEDAEKLLVSDFYQENEEERTEIMEAQRYHYLKLSYRGPKNLIEAFIPGTRFIGEIKVLDENRLFFDYREIFYYVKNNNKKYFDILFKENKEINDYIDKISQNKIVFLLGFGVGRDSYIVKKRDYQSKKTILVEKETKTKYIEKETKTKYKVLFNDKKMPLGLVVMSLEDK